MCVWASSALTDNCVDNNNKYEVYNVFTKRKSVNHFICYFNFCTQQVTTMKVQELLFVLAAVLITMATAAPTARYPCTGLSRYMPYDIDPHRYVLCDDIYGPLILFCPVNHVWEQSLQTCVPSVDVVIPVDTTWLPIFDPNSGPGTLISTGYAAPCTQQNILLNKMLFAYPYDEAKYILCDRSGDAYLKSCQTGFHFHAEFINCL